MGNGKRKASGGSVKKRQAISMETKMAIIKKIDNGEKTMKVARLFNMSSSTICTIYKNKERIKEHVKSAVPMQSTIISKRRGKLIEEMEKLLGMWMQHNREKRTALTFKLIQEKAMRLFDDLKAKAGESAADETFSASSGWFRRFKGRANLHRVSVSELTNQELMELEQMQRIEEYEEEEEEPVSVKKFDTKLMAEGFCYLEKCLSIFENQDPNAERFSKVSAAMKDAIHCYCLIYDEKKRKTVHTSLEKFFKPVSSTSAASPIPMTAVPSTSRASTPLLTAFYSDEEESVAEETYDKEETDVEDPLDVHHFSTSHPSLPQSMKGILVRLPTQAEL